MGHLNIVKGISKTNNGFCKDCPKVLTKADFISNGSAEPETKLNADPPKDTFLRNSQQVSTLTYACHKKSPFSSKYDEAKSLILYFDDPVGSLIGYDYVELNQIEYGKRNTYLSSLRAGTCWDENLASNVDNITPNKCNDDTKEKQCLHPDGRLIYPLTDKADEEAVIYNHNDNGKKYGKTIIALGKCNEDCNTNKCASSILTKSSSSGF